jgi:hypothetical protein
MQDGVSCVQWKNDMVQVEAHRPAAKEMQPFGLTGLASMTQASGLVVYGPNAVYTEEAVF